MYEKAGKIMVSYEKPLVVANEEVAEGVYAASGAGASGSADAAAGGGSVSVSGVKLVTAGNVWNKVSTYGVTIQNGGNEELKDWAATVSVTSGTATSAQVYNTWQASASLSGNTITITPGGGGTIGAGQSITVEIVVSYSSDAIAVDGK